MGPKIMGHGKKAMRGGIKRAIFIAITLVFVLMVIECSFRVMYSLKQKNSKYLTYGLSDVFKFNMNTFNGYVKMKDPGRDDSTFCRGFRTEHFPVKKPLGEYRIVALGGSSTMGLPLSYRDSWPFLLQQKLNRDFEGHKIRVINCGLAGQDTYGVNRLLNAEVFDWDADMVIIYSLFNHINFDTPTIFSKECFANRLYRWVKYIFYDKSLVVTYLLDRVALRPRGIMRKKLDLYRQLISDSINQCNDRGVKIIVVKQLIDPKYFPKAVREIDTIYNKLDTAGQYAMYTDAIDEACRNSGAFCVDFSSFSLPCRGRLNELLMPNDVVHLTKYGNDVLADILAKEMDKIIVHKLNAVKK